MKIPKLNTSKIIQVRLNETQFFQEEFPKKQIVLHHTVSSDNAKNVASSWSKTPVRVGVAFIIDREGIIYQCFSSKHWAHHLGTSHKNNKQLNRESIGIEMCSWGTLKRSPLKEGPQKAKFYSSSGIEIPSNEVVELGKPFRGSQYYQCYTEKQLQSMQILVNYLCETYKIPKAYNTDMWDYSRVAMSGNPGIYSHVSYRKDKSDCFPQIELIKVIQNLI